MNKDEFVAAVTAEVEQYGVRCHLPNERQVQLGEDMPGNGYWDDEELILAVAMGQPDQAAIRMLAHEFSHFIQWRDGRDPYVMFGKCPPDYPDLSMGDLFFGWLEGEQEVDEDTLKASCDVCRELELDCERVTVGVIGDYGLPIDVADYVRRAAAYTYFYNVVLKTRKWYRVGHEPYNHREILDMMPDTLDVDFSRTPDDVAALMERDCM